jgi:Family of unknown function (DUF6236)
MARGLIISRPTFVTHYVNGETYADGSPKKVTVSVAHELDAQQLRYQLLFWDKLAHPKTGAMEFPSAEEDFLLAEGILSKPTPSIAYDQKLRSVNHIKGLLSVQEDLDRKEPGKWSLCEPDMASYLDLFWGTEPKKGAVVNLVNCVPVPNRDVPLDDILKFKRKRSDELLALRHHLERIYQTIAGAADHNLAWRTETEALDKAIADTLKTARESKMKMWLGSLGGTLTVKDAFRLDEALAAFVAAHSAGLTATKALIPAAIAGIRKPSLQIAASAARKGASATGTPFKYVTSIHTELFPGS